MAFSIYALNNEFAVATGSNVNSAPGTSNFDDPPASSTDLIITIHTDDTDPRLFAVGDTYDVSFTDATGTHTIADATVVRSDLAPTGTGGVIVFEGLDETGSLTQVVWTPDMDLEAWYYSNFSGGVPPVLYTTDQDAAYTHGYVCFASETRIETAMGGVRAGDVWVGDLVSTLDAGPQPVLWTGRRRVAGQGSNAPVLFAPGTIGNIAPLRLSQQHRVLLRSPMAELMFGASEVLVPAKALVNGEDIRMDPCPSIEYVHLLLPAHHLLRAEAALCESLLPGDASAALAKLPRKLNRRRYAPARPILRYAEALALRGSLPPPGPRPVPRPLVTAPAL